MRSRSRRDTPVLPPGTSPPIRLGEASSARPPSTCTEREPWHKVLWREQAGYADNHTDESFLESLTVSVQPVRDYWQVVRGSAAITQQMSTVAIACAAAVYLYQVSPPAAWLPGPTA